MWAQDKFQPKNKITFETNKNKLKVSIGIGSVYK